MTILQSTNKNLWAALVQGMKPEGTQKWVIDRNSTRRYRHRFRDCILGLKCVERKPVMFQFGYSRTLILLVTMIAFSMLSIGAAHAQMKCQTNPNTLCQGCTGKGWRLVLYYLCLPRWIWKQLLHPLLAGQGPSW